MKIAYFIMAHHKPGMLLRLMNAIYAEDNLYLIHIDSGADTDLHQLARNLADSNSNIRLLPSRFLSWGGWSLVQAELDAINYLLNWDQTWEYYINLSGQDFPLVKQHQIKEFLSKSIGSNYLRSQPTRSVPKQLMLTQSHYHVEDCGKILNMGERKPFEEYFAPHIEPFYGSQWKMITRSFAEYSVTSYLSFEMQDYFRYTLIPDEAFFQTLLLNGEFKSTHVNNYHRFINMVEYEKALFRPATITMDYLYSLFNSDALFARKFDETVNSEVLNFIENALDL